jgi:hypothetical protein
VDDYKYAGVELMPSIFAELLILLFDGKQFKRTTAIEVVTKYHQDGGGLLGKKEYVSVFKKACQSLSQNGLSNIGYGTWRLNYEVQEVEIIEETVKDTVEYAVDKTIGSGDNSVYVYYYDTYRKYAEQSGNQIWECKIGRTDKDPLQRVFGQAGTCYPELPHVALILKCSNSFQLELALHNILKLRNRWIEDAPGTEWFLTSPTEVESIYHMIVGE